MNTAAQYDSMMNRRTRLEYNDNIATTSSDEPKHRGKGVVRVFLQKLNKFNRETWRSSLALAVIGLITLGVAFAPHVFERLFPATFFSHSGDIVWTQFAYPYRKPIFNSMTAALVSTLIPIAVILISQIWIRSFCDASHALLGLSMALTTGTFIIIILKKTIGGLRPHFLAVCKPVILKGAVGSGYQNIMFTVDQVCTGDEKEIQWAMESFPSGHSNIASAGFLYLSIYLFTHLRIQNRYRAGYARMVACVLPLLLATYLTSTLVLTYNHHWYDVVFGALIGMAVALMAYRMVFRSIFDSRTNATPSCHEEHEEKGILPK